VKNLEYESIVLDEFSEFYLSDSQNEVLVKCNYDGTRATLIASQAELLKLGITSPSIIAVDKTGLFFTSWEKHVVAKFFFAIPWAPSSHFRFPLPTQRLIKEILLASRIEWGEFEKPANQFCKVPREILWHILSFITTLDGENTPIVDKAKPRQNLKREVKELEDDSGEEQPPNKKSKQE
jgi:hypothetical protein